MYRQIKRSMAVLWVILAHIVLVAGATNAQIVEIDFWTSFGGANATILNEALEGFHKQYPNIKVNVVPGSQGEKLFLAIASGAPPNLAMMHGGQYSVLGMNGALEPLDPLIDRYTNFTMDDLAPGYELLGIYGGVRYALPFWDTAPTYVTLYNTLMWDRAGLGRLSRDEVPSWEDIAEYHRKLTIVSGDGKVQQIGYHPQEAEHPKSYTFETLWDTPLYSDPENYIPKINTPELADALRKVKEYFIDPTPEILGGSRSFLGWNTAMLIHGPTVVGGRIDPLEGNYDVAWAPHVDRTKVQRWRAWSVGIPKGADHLPETMLLVEYLMTNQDAINYMWDKAGAFTANREFLLDKEMPTDVRWYINTIFDAEKIVTEDMSPMKDTINAAVRQSVADVIEGFALPENALEQRQIEVMADWSEIYGK